MALVLRCRGYQENFDDKKNAIEAKAGKSRWVERLTSHPILQKHVLNELKAAKTGGC